MPHPPVDEVHMLRRTVLSALAAAAAVAMARALPGPGVLQVAAGWALVSVPVSVWVGSLLRRADAPPAVTVQHVADRSAVVSVAGAPLAVRVRSHADEALLQVWARSAARLRCDLAEGASALLLSRGDLRVEVPLATAAV